ncbi:Y+L amino acid transporter 2-like [Liolophura sinensis]|uniref:Y+L amino acid transporter 2-like n=1 Tax=Liolophura sinensis TaxID=3198878 RepID=UPI0031595C28
MPMFKRKGQGSTDGISDEPVVIGVHKLEGLDNLAFRDVDLGEGSRVGLRPGAAPGVRKRADQGSGDGLSASSSTSSGIFTIEEPDNDQTSDTPERANGTAPDGTGKTPQGTPSDSKKNDVQLKKSLTLIHCTAIMVAVTGSSSVFIAPTAILGYSGSVGAALIVWLVGGLINLMLALCFAELGTLLPTAGGPYAYVMRVFGPLPGFLIMWGYVVLIAGPFWALLAYTAALYIIQPVFSGCTVPVWAIRLLAGWLMVTFVALNCVYVKYVTKVQTFLSSTKLIALLIIIVGGIYRMAMGDVENFEDPFEGTTKEPGQMALAVFSAIFSYGGWQVMTSLMEEVKRPGKDLPRSVYITFAIVIIKYILTNVAYFALLSKSEILMSEAVAIQFIDRLYSPLTIPISIMVATTSIGALNASILGHSRLLFAGARVGHMPSVMGMVHKKYLTPWPSHICPGEYFAWSTVMLFTGGVTIMIEYISLFSTIMGLAVIISLLYLRYKKPDEKRPYKVNLAFPIIQLVVNVAVLVLGVYQKPRQMGVALIILFVGIPVYWFGVTWKRKPKGFTKLIEKATLAIQYTLDLTKTG